MDLFDRKNFPKLFQSIDNGAAFRYIPKFREFGVVIDDGGTSVINLDFCPFTGSKLPSSLRNEWFDIAEGQGWLLDGPDSPDVPEEFKSDVWWSAKL